MLDILSQPINVVVDAVTKKPRLTLLLEVAAGRLLINVCGEPDNILFGQGQQAPQQLLVRSPALAAGLLSTIVSCEAEITLPRGQG